MRTYNDWYNYNHAYSHLGEMEFGRKIWKAAIEEYKKATNDSKSVDELIKMTESIKKKGLRSNDLLKFEERHEKT